MEVDVVQMFVSHLTGVELLYDAGLQGVDRFLSLRLFSWFQFDDYLEASTKFRPQIRFALRPYWYLIRSYLLDMLGTSKALEGSLHHDGQSVTERLTLLHRVACQDDGRP